MSKLTGSRKATQFTESVIREMTRLNHLHGGVNLSQGFPDFPAPDAVKDAACAAIRADVNQYAVTWGARGFREAIAREFTRRHGMPVSPDEQVTVCCGATEAMMATMMAIIDPGDEVVVFEPFYENYGPDAIRRDEDDQADALFRELYERYPRGTNGERAAWKIGWRSYRAQHYAETASIFERASIDFPRSDYRPAWLYWSGRAHEQLHETTLSVDRLTLVTADYLNSYYGRLAVARLDGRRASPRVLADTPASLLPPPPNEPLVRALLDIGRY